VLLLCKTNVAIDGVSSRLPWGEHFFPCQPGIHEVEVSFKYLTETLGTSSSTVEVQPGQVVQVNYQSPPMIFLFLASRRGTIETVDSHLQ
jgi:hypothetical protein